MIYFLVNASPPLPGWVYQLQTMQVRRSHDVKGTRSNILCDLDPKADNVCETSLIITILHSNCLLNWTYDNIVYLFFSFFCRSWIQLLSMQFYFRSQLSRIF